MLLTTDKHSDRSPIPLRNTKEAVRLGWKETVSASKLDLRAKNQLQTWLAHIREQLLQYIGGDMQSCRC